MKVANGDYFLGQVNIGFGNPQVQQFAETNRLSYIDAAIILFNTGKTGTPTEEFKAGQLETSVPDIQANLEGQTGSQAPPVAPTPVTQPQELVQKTIDEIINGAIGKQIDEFKARATEFDEKNPFAFSEQLARQSALEQFEPYYQQILGDFLQGVETQRSRGMADEKELLSELKADVESFTGRAKMQLDRAINASAQGFSDAGLFFSGEKARQRGELQEEAGYKQGEFAREAGEREGDVRTRTSRLIDDLRQQEQLKTRDVGREQEFEVQTEVERSRLAAARKRELERQQFVGLPGFAGFGELNIPSQIYGGA